LSPAGKCGAIWASIGTAHPATVDRRDVLTERRKTVFTTERGARHQQAALNANLLHHIAGRPLQYRLV
jgi:hypothetical protein